MNDLFANNIFRLRKERGLTQEQLGETLGLTAQAISRWENGRTVPDFDSLIALSKALDVSLNELLGHSDAEEEPTGYDAYYQKHGFFLSGAPDPISLRILELRPPERATSVLLFGSEHGSRGIFLARNGYDVHVIEHSDVLCQKVQQLARVSGVPMTVQKGLLPSFLPQQQYDVIWLGSALNYLAEEARSEVLTRLQNFTLPEGLDIAEVQVGKTYLPWQKSPHSDFNLWKTGELLSAYANWEILSFREDVHEKTGSAGTIQLLTNTLIARKKTLF